MPDLHGWITQQIDRRANLAERAAHYGRPDWPQPATAVVDTGEDWPITTEAGPIAEHISDNDPAAVLRRCAADRKILEHHAPAGGNWEPYSCLGCGDDREYGAFVDHTNDCPTLQALAEGYGLTEEQRAALDRPEPERPEPGPGFQMPEAIIESLASFWLGTRPIEPSPKDKAIKILDPELKKIPGYVPVAEEPGPA